MNAKIGLGMFLSVFLSFSSAQAAPMMWFGDSGVVSSVRNLRDSTKALHTIVVAASATVEGGAAQILINAGSEFKNAALGFERAIVCFEAAKTASEEAALFTSMGMRFTAEGAGPLVEGLGALYGGEHVLRASLTAQEATAVFEGAAVVARDVEILEGAMGMSLGKLFIIFDFLMVPLLEIQSDFIEQELGPTLHPLRYRLPDVI